MADELKPCPWVSANGMCLNPRCSCHALKPAPWKKDKTDE